MPERAPEATLPQSRAEPKAPARLGEAYAAIETALAASPRGRWFLAEYLKRNRSAETDMLLEAIGRLEASVSRPQRQLGPSGVLSELVEMSQAIARTRREIAQIKAPPQFDKQLVNATLELDHIVEATEKATSDILQSAEEVQEVAWTLRERGIEVALCDQLDQRATDIYTACSFQDITGQRTEKIVKALRFIEQRINAMIEIWGVDDVAYKVDDIASRMVAFAQATAQQVPQTDVLLNGPQRRGEGLRQADVDQMLMERAAQSEGGAKPVAAADREPRSTGFEAPDPLTLETLDAVKRAALFG